MCAANIELYSAYAVYCSMCAANIELYSEYAVYCSMYAANIELYSAYAVYCSMYAANIELYSEYAVYCSIYTANIELYSRPAIDLLATVLEKPKTTVPELSRTSQASVCATLSVCIPARAQSSSGDSGLSFCILLS